MNVTIQEQDGNMVAILVGNLDTAAAAETEKAMSPLYNVEGKNITHIPCHSADNEGQGRPRLYQGHQRQRTCHLYHYGFQ